MPGNHNIISPSGAHRWITCNASARLCEKMQSRESQAAKEGTFAHELAEAYLNGMKYASDEDGGFTSNKYYNEELDVHVGNYVDYARSIERPGGFWYTEHKVPCFYSPDETECTLDRGYWFPATGEIHILDLKYGKGVHVTAVENEQERIYAACFAKWLTDSGICKPYDIKQVTYHIFQPRRDNISVWSEPWGNLCVWVENTLKPAAKSAYEGGNTPVPGEKQCRFCDAKPRCKSLADGVLKTFSHFNNVDPALLNEQEFSKVLMIADLAAEWYSNVKKFAYDVLLSGGKVEGYKLVEGTSRRVYKDKDTLKAYLEISGYPRDKWIKEDLIGIPDMEKLVGKEVFKNNLSSFIHKPSGAPTLVKEDDKRPAFGSVESDFKNFIKTK